MGKRSKTARAPTEGALEGTRGRAARDRGPLRSRTTKARPRRSRLSLARDTGMTSPDARFHETWMGMVQPIEGLVVSMPVLLEADIVARKPAAFHERFKT